MQVPESLQRYFQQIRPLRACDAEDGRIVGHMVESKSKEAHSLVFAIRGFVNRTAMLRESGFRHIGGMLAHKFVDCGCPKRGRRRNRDRGARPFIGYGEASRCHRKCDCVENTPVSCASHGLEERCAVTCQCCPSRHEVTVGACMVSSDAGGPDCQEGCRLSSSHLFEASEW